MDTLSRFERISYPALVLVGRRRAETGRPVVSGPGERHRIGVLGGARCGDGPGRAAPLVLGPVAAGLLRVRLGAVPRSGRDRDGHLRRGRGPGVASRPVRPCRSRLQRGRLEPRDRAARDRPAGSRAAACPRCAAGSGQTVRDPVRPSQPTSGAAPSHAGLCVARARCRLRRVAADGTAGDRDRGRCSPRASTTWTSPWSALVRGFRHYLGRLPSTGGAAVVRRIVHPRRRRGLRRRWRCERPRPASTSGRPGSSTESSTCRWPRESGWAMSAFGASTTSTCSVASSCLSSPRRLTVPAVLVAGSWVVVAVELVKFI